MRWMDSIFFSPQNMRPSVYLSGSEAARLLTKLRFTFHIQRMCVCVCVEKVVAHATDLLMSSN